MTTTNSITDEILLQAIDQMESPFDSHALIRDLMRRWPREYASDLYVYVVHEDPILALHASIGTRLLGFDAIEKTRKVKSANVRGEDTENQEWRKK